MRLKISFFPLTMIFVSCGLISCTSVATKNREILRDRFVKLQGLSSFPSRTCTVEASLSEPVKIKYLRFYPREAARLQEGVWRYRWEISEGQCDVLAIQRNEADKSDLFKSHKVILRSALCTLLQAHWVNSPFDELRLDPEKISDEPEAVVVGGGGHSETNVGMWVFKNDFLIETRTKQQGVLRAHYSESSTHGSLLPDWLEQRTSASVVRVDQIFYGSIDGPKLRVPLESFWISVGKPDGEVAAHTHVKISKCL